jgi:DnaD/phage-associated family protein
MDSFVVRHSRSEEMTQVSNIFIDSYMPSAGGSYVKVYLYLLRHCNTINPDVFTIHAIADLFENTEADILRALRYWDKVGVLDIEYTSTDQIASITLMPMTRPAETPTSDASQSYAAAYSVPKESADKQKLIPHEFADASPALQSRAASSDNSAKNIPPMPNYAHKELVILGEDKEVQEARKIIETMMGTPINESHLNVIIYFLSELGFSLALTVYAFENALSKGKRSPRYIEKIGFHWAEKGITTVEDAEKESSQYDAAYNIIKKNMGINRALAPAERVIIDGWKSFHFSDTILVEACKRTILNIGKPNLNYMGKILKEWHAAKVKSLSDIDKQDKVRKASATKPSASKTPVSLSDKRNQFLNYPQRNYSEEDYTSIEKQLLNK